MGRRKLKGYINAQLKLMDVIVKHQEAMLKTHYAIGDLENVITVN
ncbi:MAG: hypothetical protein WDZ35_10970 [Crocinitomicaceae bacterium]